MTDSLIWEGTYAIARALKAAHPNVDLEDVTLGMIEAWTLELPNFEDDPALVNEAILMRIYQDWFEEVF